MPTESEQKLLKKWHNFKATPFSFIGRQLYRVVIAFPFQLGARFWLRVSGALRSTQTQLPTASACFIISSVIYSKEGKKVSYGGERSIFTPAERAEQTAQSIASIRALVPGAKVVVVEAGMPGPLLTELSALPDQYIYVGDKGLVRWGVDSSIKSLGEALMLLAALPLIAWRAAVYFKMSGRYYLNQSFQFAQWQKNTFVFKSFAPDYYCTRLYGFPGVLLPVWKRALVLGIPYNIIDYPIENTLTRYIPRSKVTDLATLGLSGIGATSSEIIND